MKISNIGKVVNSNGTTTTPTKSDYWIGGEGFRIAFDFLMLDDGNVAIDSFYGSVDNNRAETFLYEVWTKDEVMEAATSLLKDAEAFLLEEGFVGISKHIDNFISDLSKAVGFGII